MMNHLSLIEYHSGFHRSIQKSNCENHLLSWFRRRYWCRLRQKVLICIRNLVLWNKNVKTTLQEEALVFFGEIRTPCHL